MKNMSYCYECDNEQEIRIEECIIETTIKGKTFEYSATIAYCNECNEEVYISELNDANVEAANKRYREIEELIQVQDIENILEMYNIGKKPFARLLGWGEVTIIRYVNGLTPTKEYSNRLKELMNPLKMLELYQKNSNVLTEASKKKLFNEIENLLDINEDEKAITPNTIAKYFLSKVDFESGLIITPLKLQKLIYYAESWCLAMINKTFFKENFRAWQHGPVIPEIYYMYKKFIYNNIPKTLDFDESIFDKEELMVLEMVWKVYGKYDAKYLEELTHSEEPWKIARKGYDSDERCNEKIDKNCIDAFYKSIKEKYKIKTEIDLANYVNSVGIAW